jgi:hypothetical protein
VNRIADLLLVLRHAESMLPANLAEAAFHYPV